MLFARSYLLIFDLAEWKIGDSQLLSSSLVATTEKALLQPFFPIYWKFSALDNFQITRR